jgi:hypothetical protein
MDERKRLGRADVPEVFRTTNEALAHAIYTLGFRFSESVPCVKNRYTSAKLADLGFDTAETAKSANRRGDVEYVFEKTPNLVKFLAAWDETAATIDRDGRNASFELPNVTIEECAAIACQLSKNRTEFRGLWKLVPTTTVVQNAGKQRQRKMGDGSIRVSDPGFREYTGNLNDAAKDRLKVK